MIDVSELMDDPDFARSFTVRRPTGTFGADGEFTSTYKESQLRGIVQPATAREVQMLGQGERLGDVISVWSAEEMRAGDGNKRESDVLVVDSKSYRVIKAEPWADAGYFRVFAEKYVP